MQASLSGLFWLWCLTVRSKCRSAAGMAGFIWLHHAQAEAFMAMLLYCNLPTSLLLSEGGFFLFHWGRADGLLFDLCLFLCQVPEWTKCSSREKRKEKKVEKPFYSDSEGESGPTESADSGNFRRVARSVRAITSCSQMRKCPPEMCLCVSMRFLLRVSVSWGV